MSNRREREFKETISHFCDPRFSRQAWNSVAWRILNSPVARPATVIDEDGRETEASRMEQYSYDQLCKDLKSLAESEGKPYREPTQLDMILYCQALHARHNTNAATFIRDTSGAKPVDESKQTQTTVNVYESLTDEELELLAKHRDEKQAALSAANAEAAEEQQRIKEAKSDIAERAQQIQSIVDKEVTDE